MREETGLSGYYTWKTVTILIAALYTTACSSVLPREKEETLSPWPTYEDARTSFDKILPGKTKVDQLGELGFDPKQTPNVTRLTYIDLLPRFLPNQSINLEHIAPPVSACILAREDCYGLEFKPGEIDRKRFGNAFLDIFGFKRRTRTTGWRFNGLILINGDLVVYTLAGGEPNINQVDTRKRPLGPLQEIDVRGNVNVN